MTPRRSRADRIAVIGGLLLAGGWTYIAFGPRGVLARQPEFALTDVDAIIDAEGTAIAKLEHARWIDAFRAVELPPPPDLDGSDVVPVRLVLECARQWGKTRGGDVLGRLGQIYLALQYDASAVECFTAAAELGRERERWLYFLGAECQTLGWTAAAIEALEQARALDGSYPVTHARLGDVYLAASRLDEADASFATAVRLRPQISIAHTGRARVALQRGDRAAAAKHLEAAIQVAPLDFAAHSLLSQTLGALGRTEEAKREAQIADRLPAYRGWVSFDERLRQAYATAQTQRYFENEIEVALGRGELARAITMGQELLARRPRDFGLLAMLATASSNVGDHARAQTLIARAVEVQPQSEGLRISQAEIAVAAQDLAGARNIASKLAAANPRSAAAHRILGRVEFLEGRGDASVASFELAIALDPAALDSRVELAEVLHLLQRTEEARAALRAVLDREPAHAWARQTLQQLDAGPGTDVEAGPPQR